MGQATCTTYYINTTSVEKVVVNDVGEVAGSDVGEVACSGVDSSGGSGGSERSSGSSGGSGGSSSGLFSGMTSSEMYQVNA